MNRVELIGNFTDDPEIRTSQGNSEMTIARFSLAVNRRFKDADGNYQADFPKCVAFGKTADFIGNYFKKGMKIGITGRIQTGSYTNKDGNKVYTTDVVVEDAEFVTKKDSNDNANAPTKTKAKANNEFMDVPDAADEELPFN